MVKVCDHPDPNNCKRGVIIFVPEQGYKCTECNKMMPEDFVPSSK